MHAALTHAFHQRPPSSLLDISLCNTFKVRKSKALNDHAISNPGFVDHAHEQVSKCFGCGMIGIVGSRLALGFRYCRKRVFDLLLSQLTFHSARSTSLSSGLVAAIFCCFGKPGLGFNPTSRSAVFRHRSFGRCSVLFFFFRNRRSIRFWYADMMVEERVLMREDHLASSLVITASISSVVILRSRACNMAGWCSRA